MMTEESANSGGSVSLRTGVLISGRYQVVRLVASGSEARVFQATDLHHGTSVAVKLPLRRASVRPDDIFTRVAEARACGDIRSPYAARVLDAGVLDDGIPFIVSEFITGIDLKTFLAQEAPLTIPDAVGLVIQAAEAVAEAHGRGIVHGDLRPSNIFLTLPRPDQPTVKVVDFAALPLARGWREADLATDVPVLQPASGGSMRYRAPEQLEDNRLIDRRADVWALGAILYELLTARPAYHGRTQEQLRHAIIGAEPQPLFSIRPAVTAELERAVGACLRKHPEDRPGDLNAVMAALAPFAPAWAAPPARPQRQDVHPLEARTPAAPVGAPPRRASRLPVAGLSGAVAVAALVFAATGWHGRHRPPFAGRARAGSVAQSSVGGVAVTTAATVQTAPSRDKVPDVKPIPAPQNAPDGARSAVLSTSPDTAGHPTSDQAVDGVMSKSAARPNQPLSISAPRAHSAQRPLRSVSDGNGDTRSIGRNLIDDAVDPLEGRF